MPTVNTTLELPHTAHMRKTRRVELNDGKKKDRLLRRRS